MSVSRADLRTALRFRLNEPADANATVPGKQLWTDANLDSALAEACRLARPLGYDVVLHGRHTGNGRLPAFALSDTASVLQIKQVTVASAASGSSDTAGNLPRYQTELSPLQWDFRPFAPQTLIGLRQPIAPQESLEVVAVVAQWPDDSVIYIDPEVVTEYALALLFERALSHGAVSARQDDASRSQQHRMNADTRKAQLLGIAALSSPDQSPPSAAPPAARRKK